MIATFAKLFLALVTLGSSVMSYFSRKQDRDAGTAEAENATLKVDAAKTAEATQIQNDVNALSDDDVTKQLQQFQRDK